MQPVPRGNAPSATIRALLGIHLQTSQMVETRLTKIAAKEQDGRWCRPCVVDCVVQGSLAYGQYLRALRALIMLVV